MAVQLERRRIHGTRGTRIAVPISCAESKYSWSEQKVGFGSKACPIAQVRLTLKLRGMSMKRSVLIVDDNGPIRRCIREILSSSKWSVCGEAADGIEAIEKAKTLRPDVVLMDISMPRMNGLEATRFVRRDLTSVKVVLVSLIDPIDMDRQAKEVGAVASISKTDLTKGLVLMLETLVEPTTAKRKRKNREVGSKLHGFKSVSDAPAE
jgi:CheY-like chemotaxis protein